MFPHQQRGNFFLNERLRKDILQKSKIGITNQMFGKSNFIEPGLELKRDLKKLCDHKKQRAEKILNTG